MGIATVTEASGVGATIFALVLRECGGDASPCNFHTKQHLREKLSLYDITEFIHDALLPRLSIKKQQQTVAIHPTCSTRKTGLENILQTIAETCSERITLPAAPAK